MKRLTLAALVMVLLAGCVTTSSRTRLDEQANTDQAVQTYIQIGYRHFENNNLHQAKAALNEALSLDDQAAGAYLGLARVFDVERETALAEENFQRAVRYGGGTESTFQYAVFLYNEGRYQAARDRFSDVTDDAFYLRRAQSFEYLALSERRLGHDAAAIAAYRRTLTLDRQRASAYLGLADLLYHQGESSDAFDAYQSFRRLADAQQSASSLWLGIRLAEAINRPELTVELADQLARRFANSEEFQLYQSWREER
ncbi:hypothetical protein BGP77_01880 [Saccharospirillum sp. MSK14-1]|uniref:tetratricopeptide repeat protein n=1 Tax=Saccharospirillum sp. MSK14-1 TaxID=1897632 RepID=UPI000D377BA0|nr:tetratricopeptide repeat protein [Saccharospirillum sp. MSK14-1]PTY36091.1 hypothetical protein BGP77_01880 [Saccharospirillum sp. MSK14-1]